MKIFLIILAVLVVITVLILSLSATFTVIYDGKWLTKIKVLWIEKDIDLIKILNMLLFPKEKAEQIKNEKAAEKTVKQEKNSKAEDTVAENQNTFSKDQIEQIQQDISINEDILQNSNEEKTASNTKSAPKKEKSNPIKSLWDKEGIVGILGLASNILQSISKAGGTLFRGFHIYSLYVKIIVGGYDAGQIALTYGTICQFYYPVKGVIVNGMKVDNYDDLIMPDYIAPCNEYGFQFIGSISVGLLLKVALSAVKTFVINLIKK